MKISIIHPSRQRPQMAAATAKKWLSSVKYPENIEYLLCLDFSEPLQETYFAEFDQLNSPQVRIINWDNHSAIEAINYGAKCAKGDLLIVVSDDFDCPYHWDEYLAQQLAGKSDYVVKTKDGGQPWIITLPIMDRVYYERFGYIYNPIYKHMFCDTEMTHVADLLDKKIELDITFKHLHYTTGAMKKDSVNEKNDATWVQGEKTYLERVRNNFDLTEEQMVGAFRPDRSHLNWLSSKGIAYKA